MPLAHSIPWRPGGESSDTPGTAEQLNAQAQWKRFDKAALKATDTTNFSDYSNDADILVHVSDQGNYQFSTDTPDLVDNDLVIEPTTGGGHFRRVTSQGELSGLYLAPDLPEFLPAVSASLDFGSISASSEATLTVTVPGARVGDLVQVQVPAALDDGLILRKAWVSAKNTVSVRLRNLTGGGIDPASGTYVIRVSTPNLIPSLGKESYQLFEALLNGDYDGTSLETALGDADTEANFWKLVSSRWRMQTLLDDATARDAIENSAIADGILTIIDGAGY